MPRNGPKMAKNYPKWPKYDPKWPKMTQNGPKMTQNGAQISRNFFLIEKAVWQTFLLLECMSPCLSIEGQWPPRQKAWCSCRRLETRNVKNLKIEEKNFLFFKAREKTWGGGITWFFGQHRPSQLQSWSHISKVITDSLSPSGNGVISW